jgi:hypothetical protein
VRIELAAYIISFSVIFILGFVMNGGKEMSRRETPEKARRFLASAFTILFVLYAFRGLQVGTDTFNYGNIFYNFGIKDLDLNSSTPVFAIYNKIIYSIIPQYQALIFFNGIITILAVALFIYYFSDDIAMSTYLYILLYIFLNSLNTSRQSLALSLSIFAVISVSKSKLFLAFLLSFLAVGVHNTAAIFVPFLFFMRKPITSKHLTKLITIASVSFVFFGILINNLTFLFVRFFPYYTAYLSTGYLHRFGEGHLRGRNIYLTLFYLLILLLYFFRKRTQDVKSERSQAQNLWLNNFIFFCVISVLIGLAFSTNLIVLRVREYFAFYFVCAIPLLCSYTKIKKYLLKVGIALILFIPFLIQITENVSGVMPYSFFWQD